MSGLRVYYTPTRVSVAESKRKLRELQKQEQAERKAAEQSTNQSSEQANTTASEPQRTRQKRIKIVNKGGVFFEDRDIDKKNTYSYEDDKGVTIWSVALKNGQRVSYYDRSKQVYNSAQIKPFIDADEDFINGEVIHKLRGVNVDGLSVQGVQGEKDDILIYHSKNMFINGNGGGDHYATVSEIPYDDNTFRMHEGDQLDINMTYFGSNTICETRHYESTNKHDYSFINNSETADRERREEKAKKELEERIRKRAELDAKK